MSGSGELPSGPPQASNDQLSALQVSVATLIERTSAIVSTNIELKTGQEKLYTKIESLDSKFVSKEEMSAISRRIESLERSQRWFLQSIGVILIGAGMVAIFKAGLLHIG